MNVVVLHPATDQIESHCLAFEYCGPRLILSFFFRCSLNTLEKAQRFLKKNKNQIINDSSSFFLTVFHLPVLFSCPTKFKEISTNSK